MKRITLLLALFPFTALSNPVFITGLGFNGKEHIQLNDNKQLKTEPLDRMNSFVEPKQLQLIAPMYLAQNSSTQKRATTSKASSLRQPIKYRMLEGKGYSLCEALLKKMNEAPAPVCAYDLLMGIPGVSQPIWRRLDLVENKELFKRLELALRLPPHYWEQAFSDNPPPIGTRFQNPTNANGGPNTMPADIDLEDQWKKAIDSSAVFYIVDEPVPVVNKSDVMLVVKWPPDRSINWPPNSTDLDQCPSYSLRMFRANLKMPVDLGSQGQQKNDYVPFEYTGRAYHFSALLNFKALTNEVRLNLFEDMFSTELKSLTSPNLRPHPPACTIHQR